MFKRTELEAKLVLLGDKGTGKTCLVDILDRSLSECEEEECAVNSDPSIHIFMQEMPHSDSDVELFAYELGKKVKDSEYPVFFEDAVITLILFDIRKKDSYISAFDKWVKLRDQYAPNSYLFFVGTYFDQVSSRQVQIIDACRESAKRDALYLEVSITDETNIVLLRRLIAQRLDQTILVREKQSGRHDVGNKLTPIKENVKVNDSRNVEAIAPPPPPQLPDYNATSKKNGVIVPFLDNDIVCGSVGGILSTALGVKYWPGFESQDKGNLERISKNLAELLDRIRTDIADISSVPCEPVENVLLSDAVNVNDRCSALQADINSELAKLKFEGGQAKPSFASSSSSYIVPGCSTSISELKHCYELMGLKLPESMAKMSQVTGEQISDAFGGAVAPVIYAENGAIVDTQIQDYLRKSVFAVKLKIPSRDGLITSKVIKVNEYLNIEDQVELFLTLHLLNEFPDAHALRQRILNVIFAIVNRRQSEREKLLKSDTPSVKRGDSPTVDIKTKSVLTNYHSMSGIRSDASPRTSPGEMWGSPGSESEAKIEPLKDLVTFRIELPSGDVVTKSIVVVHPEQISTITSKVVLGSISEDKTLTIRPSYGVTPLNLGSNTSLLSKEDIALNIDNILAVVGELGVEYQLSQNYRQNIFDSLSLQFNYGSQVTSDAVEVSPAEISNLGDVRILNRVPFAEASPVKDRGTKKRDQDRTITAEELYYMI